MARRLLIVLEVDDLDYNWFSRKGMDDSKIADRLAYDYTTNYGEHAGPFIVKAEFLTPP